MHPPILNETANRRRRVPTVVLCCALALSLLGVSLVALSCAPRRVYRMTPQEAAINVYYTERLSPKVSLWLSDKCKNLGTYSGRNEIWVRREAIFRKANSVDVVYRHNRGLNTVMYSCSQPPPK